MSLVVSNSPDLSFIRIIATWDVSNPTPKIVLDNQSQGLNLAAVSWAFVAKSPTGTFIHNGNIDQPDVSGVWTTFQITDAWPRPFNQIEWSGAPYTFYAIAKDSDGNVYTAPLQNAFICRPAGNTKLSKNTYGLATAYLQVNCQNANIYFQDTTNHSYKSLDGTLVSSVLRVVYPIDETATIPTPFEINNFTNALVPITYSSDNYQYLTSSVYLYEFENDVNIKIKYQSFNPKNGSPAVTFAVLCNIDLCPLMCEIDKLRAQIESGNCANVEESEQKLIRISPLLWMIGMGIQQPLCGVDVPALIEQVKAIGGFDCNCCNAPTGIIPTSSSPIDGYNFQIVTVCGDIAGTVNQVGNNIQFLLQDKKYVFKMCESSPPTTTAFTVTPLNTGDCTVQYCLNVDGEQMAQDVLTNIANNVDLINLLNSLIVINPGQFDLVVDGDCIFNSSSTCDYDLFLADIPASVTFALLYNIKIGSVNHPLSFAFNLTNLPGLQAYLNGLGFGTFVVASAPGGVLVTSAANPNDIQSLSFKISGTTYLADLAKVCAGYIPISANEVVQNIIDYICGLDDTQIVTSQDFTICYIDPDTGLEASTIVTSGAALTTFITALLARGCDTVTYILNKPPVTCAEMKTLFPTSVATMGANDYFFGVKNDSCARIGLVEAFTAMLVSGQYDAATLEAFCVMVALCGGGLPCAPYNVFNVSVTDYDPSCPEVIGFDYSFSGADLQITNITFSNTPTANQTVTIEYKLQEDSAYTLYSASVDVATDGQPTTPVSISLDAGLVYNVRISDNCESPATQFVDTITVPGNPATVRVSSSMAGVTVTAVNNISGYTLSAPLAAGGVDTGSHNAFTAAIQFVVTGTPVFNPSGAYLLKNSVVVDCQDVTGAGPYNFPSTAFVETDFIEIQLSLSPCV